MACPKKINEVVSKSGELVLEYIFDKYVTIWLREKAISAVQYEKARKEIDILKSKPKKRHVAPDRHSPAVDDGMVWALRSENEMLKQENARLKQEVKMKNKRPGSSSVRTDHRNAQGNEELKKENMELKRKIDVLKEKKAQVMAYADIEGKEKESQIAKLREHLEKAREDIETFKMRLSKLAGDKLRDGNPDIADLSDPHRPTQLGTHFSEIYDNEWSDAFEALPKDVNEETKVRILHGIVKMAFDFSKEQFDNQTIAVRNILLAEDDKDKNTQEPCGNGETNPDGNENTNQSYEEECEKTDDENKRTQPLSGNSRETEGIVNSKQSNGKRLEKTAKTLNIESDLKALRKVMSLQTACNIGKNFAEGSQIMQYATAFGLSSKHINNKVKQYAGRCAELSWLMVTCDPPMCLSEDKEKQPFDNNLYRPYTKSVKDLKDPVVHLHVWPALKLHYDGPLVAKGVAQPGENRKKTSQRTDQSSDS